MRWVYVRQRTRGEGREREIVGEQWCVCMWVSEKVRAHAREIEGAHETDRSKESAHEGERDTQKRGKKGEGGLES